MSFLSVLGNIGKSLIGMGGPSANSIADKVIQGIGAAGPVLGAAAGGSAQQRMAEGNQAVDFARLGQDAARDKFLSDLQGSNAQFGAGMQSAQFNREGQDRERKQALLSSLLGGMQDFKATPGNPEIAARMGQVSGGLRPSALTGNREALMSLLAQPQVQAPSYMAPSPFVAPALPQQPKAGLGENIMGGIGLGGSILGAIGGMRPQVQPRGQDSRVAVPPNLAFLPQSPELLALIDPKLAGGVG